METSFVNKITGFVIALILGAILVGGMLAPTIEAITSTNSVTYTNTENEQWTFKLDGQDDYIFSTAPEYYNYTVNGVKVDTNNLGGTIISTDKCRVEKAGHFIALYDETGVRSSNVNNTQKLVTATYTAESKTFTYTVYTDTAGTAAESTYTYSVQNIIYFIPGGDYAAINTNGDPDITYYVNDLSQVIAGGAYTTGALDTSYFAEGATVYVGNAAYTATATATTTGINDINGVIKGSGYTITVTDGENSETFTPYTVFVPLKVVGHTDNQIIYNTMFGVITLLGIVMLVVFAANAVRNKY